jgi:hypothetical protein
MIVVRAALAAALLSSAVATQAATVVIIVEPMTLDHYTKVIDTPGPDRVLMCMAPPSTSGCTEVKFKSKR